MVILDFSDYVPYNYYRDYNNRAIERKGGQMQKELVEIPLERIAPDPEQPRKVFDTEPLDELARSLETNGLLQPISVREQHQSGNDLPTYIIIS